MPKQMRSWLDADGGETADAKKAGGWAGFAGKPNELRINSVMRKKTM